MVLVVNVWWCGLSPSVVVVCSKDDGEVMWRDFDGHIHASSYSWAAAAAAAITQTMT